MAALSTRSAFPSIAGLAHPLAAFSLPTDRRLAMTRPSGHPRLAFPTLFAEHTGVLFSLFLFVAVATSVIAHTRPHADAVMDAEVATNLVMGKGAVTYQHPQTVPGSRFAGWTTIHILSLTAWIWLFGFSSTSVMSMNVVLVALTTSFAWLFLSRASLLRHRWSRMAFVIGLPLIEPVMTLYRLNRYDPFGPVALSAACASLTVTDRRLRLFLLMFTGFTAGMCGLHVIIGAGLLALLALLVLDRTRFFDFLVFTLGLTLGLSAYLIDIFYLHPELSVALRTALTLNAVQASRSLHWYLVSPLRGGQESSFFDIDLVFVIAMLVTAYGTTRSYRNPVASQAARFGCVVSILIPLLLSLFGRYSGTYAWLAVIPAFTCCIIVIDAYVDWTQWTIIAAVLLSAASFLGFPARALMVSTEWQEQGREQVDRWIENHIAPGDVVYACHFAFYPVKRTGCVAYIGDAFHAMTDEQKNHVNVLVMDGHENGSSMFEPDPRQAMQAFGGEWDLIAELRIPRGVFRQMLRPSPHSDCTAHAMIYRKCTP